MILDSPGPFSGRTSQPSDLTVFSHPAFVGLKDGVPAFANVLAHYAETVHLTAGLETENVDGDLVSGTFFETLGLKPAVGRLLTPDDDKVVNGHPVVVLGHAFWTRRFASDPGVVGRSVLVNGHPMTIIGVAPRGFHSVDVGASVDLFVPITMQERILPTWGKPAVGEWRTRWLTVMARLKDGVTIEQARPAAQTVYAQLLQEDLKTINSPSERFQGEFLKRELKLLPGGRGPSWLRDQSQTPILLLMGMVGLVLLIACANVANLLLARASSRQKEIAVRLALGASRGRLVRQLLAESVTLALSGGALGILVATWMGSLLLRALPSEGAAQVLTAEADARVALFAFALSVLTGLAFGLVPGLQATRPALSPTLKSETAAVAGGTAPFRFRKGLVIGQIALSLLLLIGAGLFTRSLLNLRVLTCARPSTRPRSETACGTSFATRMPPCP